MTKIPEPEQMWAGQPYWRVGSRPWTRADGVQSEILTWQGFCADCRKPFTFEYGAAGRGFPENPARRCNLHRRPGVRVNGKADRARISAEKETWESLGAAAQSIVGGLR